MKLVKEFRDFAMRGNVIDLAVGVIIGGAFGKIVSSIVEDVIMPPIGLALGGVNFADMFVSLDGSSYDSLAIAKEAGAPVIAYGQFISVLINFIIIAFCVFLLIKGINSLRKKQSDKPAAPTEKECPYCLSKVPLKATRCAHCTSQLEAVPGGEA